jgi:hypothetical protein
MLKKALVSMFIVLSLALVCRPAFAILGDVNGDGKVNLIDVFMVSLAFGSRPGDPKWNPNADLNHDGTVNLMDTFIVALNFGK